MTFIRPEIRAFLAGHLEGLAWALAAFLGLVFAWRSLDQGGWSGAIAGGLIAVLCGMAAVTAWRRRRFADRPPAAGVVEIDEQRIGYYARIGGGFADLAELSRLEIRSGRASRWVLTLQDGARLIIPTGAAGAERLIDVFAALPGFRIEAALEALDQKEARAFLIWKR